MKLQFDLNRNEIFDKFLNDELSPSEVAQFNEAIEQDEKLKADFLLSKDIHIYFKNERRKILKQVLVNLENKEVKKRPKGKIIYMKMAVLAACLCGVIFFGNHLLNPDHSTLYLQHFEAYPNVEMVTVRSGNTESTLDSQLMSLYEAESYQKTVDHYEHNGVSNTDIQFYMAIAYMKIEEMDLAKDILTQIPKESKYYEKSRWYLSLCYLNEDDFAAFSEIAETLKYNKETAEEIIKALK